jgi:hypothetical protein
VPLRLIHPGEIVQLQHLQAQQLFLRVSLRHPEQGLIGGVAEFAAYLRFVSPEICDSINRVSVESITGVVCACSLDELQVLNQPSEWNRLVAMRGIVSPWRHLTERACTWLSSEYRSAHRLVLRIRLGRPNRSSKFLATLCECAGFLSVV